LQSFCFPLHAILISSCRGVGDPAGCV
jgi:hypothetical protein